MTAEPIWGSDVVLSMLRELEIEFAAVMPGASFRGIHDSIVNFGGDREPALVLCPMDMATVSVARGYARVTGRPMVAIVHNLVGLLQSTMTIFDAWADRVPVIVLGGTGPVAADQRRPWIDCIHTAQTQGHLVRDFTKWDDQPGSIAAVPASLLRAHRMAVTEPPGPVYVCFDSAIQEGPVPESLVLPDVDRYRAAAPAAPRADVVEHVAALLLAATLPVCVADRVGRSREAFAALVELAEMLAMPVLDTGRMWHNFPTPHPLDFHGLDRELLSSADLVLGLDPLDLAGTLATHDRRPGGASTPTVVNVSNDELIHRGFVADYQQLAAVDVPVLASPTSTLPLLVTTCAAAMTDAAAERIARRRATLAPQHEALRQRQREADRRARDGDVITEARLIAEIWDAVGDVDVVFTVGQLRRMAPGVCDLPSTERFIGGGTGGGAVGSLLGVAIGAALAMKGTGKVPIALIGDGEMFASSPTLWTAAHYEVPSLFVVVNNRSYLNDEIHQGEIARRRGRPQENRFNGTTLHDPPVDFAALARSMGMHGEGPVTAVADLSAAVRRAVDGVAAGEPVVLDVWTDPR